MSHRCEEHRHLHSFENTFNLFLTLPPHSRIPKQTRGSLKKGLVSLFAPRIRRVVYRNGELVFCPAVGAKVMHSTFEGFFPAAFKFPSAVPREWDPAVFEGVLRHALRTLLGKAAISPEMREFLDANCGRRQQHEVREYELSLKIQSGRFRKNARKAVRTTPKPWAKVVFSAKPRARSLQVTFRNDFIYF